MSSIPKLSYPMTCSVLFCLVVFSPTARAVTYEYHDLGTLGGSSAGALDVNKHRQVVGWSVRNDDPECFGSASYQPCRYGFLWEDGQMTDLGHLNADAEFTYANAINKHGIIVGTEIDTAPGSADYRVSPFLFDEGGMQALPLLDPAASGEAMDINNYGVVVGWSDSPEGYDTIAVWKDGDIQTPVPAEAEFYRRATGINEWGLITAGHYKPWSGDPSQAIYVWGSALHILADDESVWSEAFATNNFNVIAGNSAEEPFRPGRAAIWRWTLFGGYEKMIVGPGTDMNESTFHDINDKGEAVGFAIDDHGESYAIYYDGTLHDLNALVPTEDVHYSTAEAINFRGDIVGQAMVHGMSRAFLLEVKCPW